MSPYLSNCLLAAALSFACGVSRAAALPEEKSARQSDGPVLIVFAGSTPCDDTIRPLLQSPQNVKADMIRWKLILHQDPKTSGPAGYELDCTYGLAVPGPRGLDTNAKTLQKQGRWTVTRGIQSNPEAVVYELDGTVSLLKVDADILHVLNRDRSLMVGGTGWSYTLYRTERSEPPVDPALAAAQPPEGSYTLPPIPTGPEVFGVFAGRSPCQRIAHELGIPAAAGFARVKWRITLFQDPETHVPTRYSVNSSLHRETTREGKWTILRGTESDPQATVYRLEATETERALFLLKGDDNVLFFLDQNRKPLAGNADLSYTLNRKKSAH